MRSMRAVILLACSLVILAACSPDSPSSPASSDILPGGQVKSLTLSAPQTLINNFIVQYDGRTVTMDETTFHYTVFGTGIEPALSHFTLELPDCAPALSGYAPTNSVSINTNPRTGIYGIEWHLRVEADDSIGRSYAISFPGDVPEGVVRSAVQSGNTDDVGLVPGPCAGFLVAGTVFVDADADGDRQVSESGIGGVVVELLQDGIVLGASQTDPLGAFSFLLPEGTYSLRIDLEAYPDAFNTTLQESFDPSTPLEVTVELGPDSQDNNFGFSPRSEEIILDLENGELLSNGKTVKFWTQELRRAINGGNGNGTYDPQTMLEFVAAIENLYLAEIFQFTPGNELREAYDILRSKSRDPLDILTRELLATEFNEVSGQGLIGDAAALQGVLIAWGEAILLENLEVAAASLSGDRVDMIQLAAPYMIDDATRIFSMINTGGGGSVDE